ncbi:MAG: 4-demethylwyosine synthase TYW1 [Archaeoglobi archaeon]|jgi:tRNA wybutosine-synthesizing protein 1|nr:4-demethylwyosine synthase TYW1 [Archaeoglobus sp.]NHW89281.1 4-demethylwyosine synthase TYW1 [Archaeoglobales archaeon]TDA25578.1 MAG: 4-demethylwyosine synthase TYW1 [Archaeoglobi archaeon]
MKQLADLKGYQLIGNHSAVKTCLWLKKSLKDLGFCYKQKFYGIQSHRCLQMTPALLCNQSCIHCWRPLELLKEFKGWDEPEKIVEESIKAQKRLLSGFYGTEGVNLKKLKEAENPNQVAISLIGEPTLYPYLPELIECYKRRGFTTFLVTNGTMPEVIARVEPTQLYISLTAFDEKSHIELNRPVRSFWERILRSLEVMSESNSRRVVRLTLIKGLNMHEKAVERFDQLIKIAEPDYVEAKAYMFLGYSRLRLKYENMPSHEEVLEFSRKLGYEIVDESEQSRVCLLRP